MASRFVIVLAVAALCVADAAKLRKKDPEGPGNGEPNMGLACQEFGGWRSSQRPWKHLLFAAIMHQFATSSFFLVSRLPPAAFGKCRQQFCFFRAGVVAVVLMVALVAGGGRA